MLFSELAGLTAKDLNKKKKELRSKLFEAKMKNSLGQLANPMVIGAAKKDIARINTALAVAAMATGSTTPKAAKRAAPSAPKKSVAKKASKAAKPSRAKKG